MNEGWASRPKVAPLYQSAAYQFAGLDEVEAVQDGLLPGYVYARYGSPTVDELERQLAGLEGSSSAVVVASGMAAMFVGLFQSLAPGDHVIAGDTLYGGTMTLLADVLPRWGVSVSWVDATDAKAAEAAWTPRTRAVVIETVTNPLLDVSDLMGLGSLCRERESLLIVDNTFATPRLVRPLEYGASAVIHSVTKFLCGHSDVTLGTLVGNGELVERARRLAITVGCTPDPFAAWLATRGLRTFELRLDRQCQNAGAVARFLSEQPQVARVFYPGLQGHAHRERACRLLAGRGGAMVSFELAGGREAADRFIRGLKIIRFVPSLGDVSTTLSHPATTSHRALSPEDREARGISQGLLRLSVGCESESDITSDLERGLAAVRA